MKNQCKLSQCKHERIESNMVPEQCSDCGKLTQGVSEETELGNLDLLFALFQKHWTDEELNKWFNDIKIEVKNLLSSQRSELLKVLEGMKKDDMEWHGLQCREGQRPCEIRIKR